MIILHSNIVTGCTRQGGRKLLWELLEQWREKQFVGRWARKRREKYGWRFWKQERLVKPAIERIRCWLGEEYGYSAEKDQEAGLAAQFGKGR